MHIDIRDMINVTNKDSFIKVFSGMLNDYLEESSNSDFDPRNLKFTCQDLLVILRANTQEIKPPQDEWSMFLKQREKSILFEMFCKGATMDELEKEVYRFIKEDKLFYFFKVELFQKIKSLNGTIGEIASNVYNYYTD